MSADTEASDRAAGRRARRGHGRATLQAVAELAGVTAITVSRYLRQPDVVAPPTAARIQDALRRTGYVPNRQAGQLASGRSRIVAALIPNLGHSIFAETLQGLSEGLQAGGHELLLASTDYSLEREEEQLRALLGWAPAALVVTGRRHSPGTDRLLRDAHRAGWPVIEIWDHQPDAGDGFAQIGFDHGAVGRAMARHLLSIGRRALVYVDSGVAADFRAHERGAAFADEARRAGARVQLLQAGLGDPFDAGRAVFHGLPRAGGRRAVDAVACSNDQLACGLLMEAQAHGLALPRELALLGFGDFPIGRQLRPALSTVRPPRYEIGRAAADALLESLASGRPPASRELPWQLIERGSTVADAS